MNLAVSLRKGSRVVEKQQIYFNIQNKTYTILTSSYLKSVNTNNKQHALFPEKGDHSSRREFLRLGH